MRLFSLLYRGSVLKEDDAIWDIIVLFRPLIISACMNKFTGRVDEDMMSEMYIALHRRIKNFVIFKE